MRFARRLNSHNNLHQLYVTCRCILFAANVRNTETNKTIWCNVILNRIQQLLFETATHTVKVLNVKICCPKKLSQNMKSEPSTETSYKRYFDIGTGFSNFAERSNVHGVHEACSGKNWVFRIMWIILLCISLGISIWQISNVISDYINHPTKIQIQIFDEAVPYYPPLVICYPHWMLWVDEKKATKLGLDRNSILYGMSYLSPVYSKRQFNVTRAKANFFQFLHNNSIKNFQDFYLNIAKDDPPFFMLFTTDTRFKFQKVIMAPRFEDLSMCYTLSSENVTNLLDQQLQYNTDASSRAAPRTVNIGYSDIESPYPHDMLDKDEINAYLLAALKNIFGSFPGLNETALSEIELLWPPIFSVDGNEVHASSQTFATGIIKYVIKINGKVFKWRDSSDKPCVDSKAHVQHYEECAVSCACLKITKK